MTFRFDMYRDRTRYLKRCMNLLRYDLPLEHKLATETTVLVEQYTLPDGRVIKVGSERFEAPEALFQPHLVDVESPGVAGNHPDACCYV